MKEKITLTAVGDVGFRIEENGDTFNGVRDIMAASDIRFGQLEQLISGETAGVRHLHFNGFEKSDINDGYGWSPTPEKALKVLKDAHLNVMSFATNHSIDIGDEAFFETIDSCRENGIAICGAGRDLEDARKPVIMDVKGTKVGFLAYCSVAPKGYEAAKDHAGCVPLRASTSFEPYDSQPGMPPQVHSAANAKDKAAMIRDIEKLREQVDVVVVCMHWGVHFVPELVAEYQVELSHAAIDAGADLIIGNHPHIMKGMDVYKGKAIFYSLNNFSMRRHEEFTFQAEKASGLWWFTRFGVRMLADPDCPRYPYDIDAQKTLIVRVEIEDGKISRVAYTPLWIDKDGIPMPVSPESPKFEEHLYYVRRLSGSQGFDVDFVPDGSEVVINTEYPA